MLFICLSGILDFNHITRYVSQHHLTNFQKKKCALYHNNELDTGPPRSKAKKSMEIELSLTIFGRFLEGNLSLTILGRPNLSLTIFGRPNMVKLKLGRPNMVKLKFPSKNRPNMVKLSSISVLFSDSLFSLHGGPVLYSQSVK